MFGYPMKIEKDGLAVVMRGVGKADLDVLVKGFSDFEVARFTAQMAPKTYDDELEWYEKVRKSTEDVLWIIEVNGKAVGVSGLHHLPQPVSGIVIWEKDWWGKGVAGRAHLGRIHYADKHLNLATIASEVRTVNTASLKALQRVGYTVWGTKMWNMFRDGKWLSTYEALWLNPRRVEEFGEELPEMYKEGVRKARIALAEAEKWVSFC